MKKIVKKINDLTVADLEVFPVWEFTNSDEEKSDETAVRSIKETPVRSLIGRLIGTQIRLSNGTCRWALIGNIDVRDPHSTRHFLALSVFDGGYRFDLARYHDFYRNERGPRALASFLGLKVNEVFPISYDISGLCVGDAAALVGVIEEEPREMLTDAQIIELAMN